MTINQQKIQPASQKTALPQSIMKQLRDETQSSHKEIESVSCFKRLFSPDYSLEEYRNLLIGFYGYHEAIESILFEELPEFSVTTLQHRSKCSSIILDLQALGINKDDIIQLPLCDKLPQLNSFAQHMGAFYVLEGSTLGGQVISRRLLEHFGQQILQALNYYQCYGEQVGTEWRNFQVFLSQHFNNDDKQTRELINSANATFKALTEWMQHPPQVALETNQIEFQNMEKLEEKAIA